jgi:hypothetical protein
LAVRLGRVVGLTAICATFALPCTAQVTPAAGYTPPDDTPSIRIGAVFYGDYTFTQKPKSTDADGNEFSPNSFNIGRAYLNVTGNISHRIAFRITPDITRETGTGSSLNGSYTFRLKYGYGQFNLDDWMTRGSWVRLGMQQTPWVDFEEQIYRYRFQGTVFAEREGFMSSSDVGATFHYNLKRNYGEIHGGFYNGENYNHFEANDQKSFQVRGTLRPLPGSPALRGLRVTGFYNHDAYVKNADRTRGLVAATFEHPHLNAAIEYLATTDQTSVKTAKVKSKGVSFWATPRQSPSYGWEGLFRVDWIEPNKDVDPTRSRVIVGAAYWFPHQGTVSSALLVDFENVGNNDFTPPRADERRYAVHALISF